MADVHSPGKCRPLLRVPSTLPGHVTSLYVVQMGVATCCGCPIAFSPAASSTQSGKTVKLSAFRKQSLGPLTLNAGKNVVLFFYPADATPGCTKEACAFRDAYSDFVSAGAVVLGVSSDSAESHASFADANDLPFPLLVDEGDEVRNAYGVPADLFGLIKGRQTFVIDTDGNVVLSFNNQFAPDDHVKKTLAVLGA